MRPLLILILLLGGAAPLAAQQRAALQSGTVDLPPGFQVRSQRGTDSYPGMIVRADAFLWMVEHRVSGYVAYTGLFEEEGRRWIATTIHGDDREPPFTLPANFTAEVRSERDVAEFILITSTYRPTGRDPETQSSP